MSKRWPTKEKDLQTAQVIIEEYAYHRKNESLGLFEIVVDQMEKRMNFRLSAWVLTLAKHFIETYGVHQGDYITRQIVSRCITQNATLH